MSEVKRYDPVFDAQEIYQLEGDVVFGADFDRVTAERDALQALLTAADERADKNAALAVSLAAEKHALSERADVLEAENRRLREDDLFYDAACEAMEGHQKERAKRGKEIGCQGSLIDGIAWIYQRLAELEKSPSGYTKQHHPVEFGPSDSRRIGCSCGHSDPNHMIALKPADPPLPGVWLGEDCEQESREPGFSVHVHPAVRLGSGVCLSSYGHRGVPYEVASRSMTFVSMSDHKCPKKSYAVKAITRGVKHPCGILVNGVIYYCVECKK